VAVFLSTFENKVDRKGRVSIPASFRGALEQEKSTGIILYPSFKHACIEGNGDERIQEIVNSIDALDAFSDEAENLQTILADARQLAIDSDGRIILPSEFIEYAQLDGVEHLLAWGKVSRFGGLKPLWSIVLKTEKELVSKEQRYGSSRAIRRW